MKQVYSGLLISSTILGVTGLVQFCNTQGITKTLALTIGVAGTSSALVCAGLGIAYDGKNQSQQRELDEKIQDIERVKKAEINGLELEIKNLKSTITTLETQGTQYVKEIALLKSQLNLKAEQYLKIIAEKDLKISKLSGIVSQRDIRVADFLEDSRGYVSNFLSLRYQSLDSLQKSLEKAVDNVDVVPLASYSFERRIGDIRELKGELLDALNEIKSLEITDFKIVLYFIFKFDNKFLNVKVRWKDLQAKEVKTENTNLRDSLAESMPKVVAIERLQDGLNDFDTRITEKYETLLLNNNSIHAQLLDLLEQRNLVINELQQHNDALQKPLLAVGTSDYAVSANRIANYYYENYGYKLDVIHWLENETGYSVLYATRRNPGLTETELLPHNTKEQLAAFTNCLEGTLPKFTFNYQHSTVTLDITLRKPAKKDNSKDDIDKIWIPVSKFESYVKRWERIRITAGSTGGKSPTAKNLALAIMNSRHGQGEIKLYDPQHGSKKDYWNMPKSGTSHADNLTGMKEVCKLIDERRHGSNHPFVLYIFDEVDNTVTQLKEGAKFKDLIKVSLKEGSHANVGVIYIGQSADANEVPGMTHSNWGNAVQLHIGSNAGAVIETMKTLTAEDSEKLLKQYRKIQEYCDRQNEELGLDIFTDAGAYRFALAVPLTGLPKFIQLPPFDTYEYSEVMRTASESKETSRHIPEDIRTFDILDLGGGTITFSTYKVGRLPKAIEQTPGSGNGMKAIIDSLSIALCREDRGGLQFKKENIESALRNSKPIGDGKHSCLYRHGTTTLEIGDTVAYSLSEWVMQYPIVESLLNKVSQSLLNGRYVFATGGGFAISAIAEWLEKYVCNGIESPKFFVLESPQNINLTGLRHLDK